MSDKIGNAFNEYFASSKIKLPDPILPQGNIQQAGWTIKYILNEDDQGQPCLDFFAEHRMTNPRHVRIDSNGNIMALDSFLESFTYDSEVEGDEEKARKRFEEHNLRIAEILKAKGFYG